MLREPSMEFFQISIFFPRREDEKLKGLDQRKRQPTIRPKIIKDAIIDGSLSMKDANLYLFNIGI